MLQKGAPSTFEGAGELRDDLEADISFARHVVEVMVAITLCVVTLPVLLLAVVISAVSFRSNPLFAQHRVGRGGQMFVLRKVRTLPPHTNRYAEKGDLSAVHLPAAMRLVRRLHLDELPQLWNVVLGDMSLIGPRPEMEFLHREFPPVFAAARTSIRPGITGLWQVSVAARKMIRDHPEYDLLYLQHRGLGLDLWIAGQTLRKMFGGRMVTFEEVCDRLAASPTEVALVGQKD